MCWILTARKTSNMVSLKKTWASNVTFMSSPNESFLSGFLCQPNRLLSETSSPWEWVVLGTSSSIFLAVVFFGIGKFLCSSRRCCYPAFKKMAGQPMKSEDILHAISTSSMSDHCSNSMSTHSGASDLGHLDPVLNHSFGTETTTSVDDMAAPAEDQQKANLKKQAMHKSRRSKSRGRKLKGNPGIIEIGDAEDESVSYESELGMSLSEKSSYSLNLELQLYEKTDMKSQAESRDDIWDFSVGAASTGADSNTSAVSVGSTTVLDLEEASTTSRKSGSLPKSPVLPDINNLQRSNSLATHPLTSGTTLTTPTSRHFQNEDSTEIYEEKGRILFEI